MFSENSMNNFLSIAIQMLMLGISIWSAFRLAELFVALHVHPSQAPSAKH